MKKLFLFCTLCAAMLTAHAAVYSDTHGDFSWTLDTETGILEFSGTGEIVSYVGWWGNYKNDIRSIVINQGITSLSTRIFQDYELLQTVSLPEGLERIGSYAFSGCRALSSCNLPSTVRKIGSSAFYACALTSVVIPEGVDTLLSTFNQDTTLKSVSLPSTIEYMDQYVFYNNRIETVVLAEGIKTIPADMFKRDYLKTINIPSSFTSIPRICFYNYTALKNVTIAAGVDSICEKAFYGCSSLESIELPEGLKYIGSSAFRNAGIVSITIPSTVTKIEPYAFCCPNLQTVIIDNAELDLPESAFYSCAKMKTVSFGNGIKSIGSYAFNNCTSLESVVFPSACAANSIWGNYAFMHCDSLRSIVIPEGVDSLGEAVFGYCDALESVSFPSTVTKFGKRLLTDCSSLSSIHFAEGLKSCPKNVFSDKWGSLKSINIPASFGSVPVEYLSGFKVLENVTIADGIDTIGSNAFSGCTALESIAFPNGLKFIGPYAFSSSGLTSVTIPSTVTYMGQRAFHQCTSLTQAQIRNAVIPSEAFYRCSNLTQVTFGDGTRTIGEHAFCACDKLRTIDLNKVTEIGNYAFSDCPALKTVNLSSVQYLGSNAFMRSGLTDIEIPSSVSRMGASVFYSCKSLTNVNIQAEIDSLSGTFRECGKLTSIDIPSTIKYLNYAFENDTIQKMYVHWQDPSVVETNNVFKKGDTLYVPIGTRSLYVNRYPWRDFQYILEMPLKTYNLKICGVMLNERNYTHIADSVPGVTGTVTFNPSTHTLSLTDAVLTTPDVTQAIWNTGISDLTIEVHGTCDLNTPYCIALRLDGNTTIVGTDPTQDSLKVRNAGPLDHQVGTGSAGNPGMCYTALTTFNSASLTINDCSVEAEGAGGVLLQGSSRLTLNRSRFTARSIGTPTNNNQRTVMRSFKAQVEPILNQCCLKEPEGVTFSSTLGGYTTDGSELTREKVIFGSCKNCFDVETEFSAEADGSYEWNGHVYTASGDYQQVLQTVGGCDSTVTLHLTIQPAGKCGDNLRWTLKQSTGELIITGTGAMYDYAAYGTEQAPWTIYSDVVKSVSLPDGITYIGKSAFEDMTAINQAVVLPESITSLGEACFSGCSAMPGINIPSQVTVIPSEVFLGCYALRSLSIPAGVTSIGDYAFSNCWWAFSHAELVLPEGLQTIGRQAFFHDRFTSITIPASVTTIGEKAFDGCDSPYSYAGYSDGVAYYVNNPSPLVIPTDVFNAETANVDTLHVPCGREEAYRAADGWNRFSNIIAPQQKFSEFSETAEGSYTWNGTTYTESGDYEQTFPMTNGCDSIVTLHLTIIEPSVELEVAYACDFTKQAATNNNGYATTWIYDNSWNVFGGSTNRAGWAFCKFGGKASTLVDANPVYVEAVAPFTRAIKQVKVHFAEGSSNNTSEGINQWGIISWNANTTDTVFGDKTAVTSAASTVTFLPTQSVEWSANRQYKLYLDLFNNTTNNGVIWVSNIEFLAEKIATAIDNTTVEGQAVKVLRNGQLLILRGDKTYTVTGQEIR